MVHSVTRPHLVVVHLREAKVVVVVVVVVVVQSPRVDDSGRLANPLIGAVLQLLTSAVKGGDHFGAAAAAVLVLILVLKAAAAVVLMLPIVIAAAGELVVVVRPSERSHTFISNDDKTSAYQCKTKYLRRRMAIASAAAKSLC